jgi:hypothetical protein
MRLYEFSPHDNDGDSGEEDILHKYARMWWTGDDATQQQIERALAKMGWEIGEDEGGYDNGGVFVVRAGDENGRSYTSWAAEDLTEGVTEDSTAHDCKHCNGKGYHTVTKKDGTKVATNCPQCKGKGYIVTKGVAEGSTGLSIQQLATISDEALDNAYHYGRSTPGNTFGWQANLKSAAYAKQMIDKGVTDIEAISDAIHKGWNTTAQAFVKNPDQFSDTEKLKAAGKLEAKLQQRAQLMKQNYAQLPEEEKEKDRVVARALLQAIKGEQGVAEGELDEKSTSQAQFRTMAAAAHNPAFAKKVGIKQSVAREFNRADTGQNYKSLPKKAD